MKKKSGFVDSGFIVRSYDFFFTKWAFNNYVDQILTHFDLPPPQMDIQSIPYQMTPWRLSTDLLHLVHVVIECPLTAYPKKKFPIFKKKVRWKSVGILRFFFTFTVSAIFADEVTDVDKSWMKLNNALAGQFCASLNFLDSTQSINPNWSFSAKGILKSSLKDSSTQ